MKLINPLKKFTIFKDKNWQWQTNIEIDNLLSLNIKFLKQAAFWPIDYTKTKWFSNNSNWLPQSFTFLLSLLINWFHFGIMAIAALHLAILFVYSTIMKIIHPTEDTQLVDISDCLFQALIYSLSFTILIYYRVNHNKCAEMVEFMNNYFKRRSTIGSTYVTIEPCYLIARTITSIWTFMLVGGVVFTTFLPIYTMKWVLPLPQVLYPFDYQENNLLFFSTYIGQCLGQLSIGYSLTSFENMLITMAIMMCGQMDILFCSMKNCRYTAMLINSLNNRHLIQKDQSNWNADNEEADAYYYSFERFENLTDLSFAKNLMNQEFRGTQAQKIVLNADCQYLTEYDIELKLALKACIKHHHIILNTCKLMEEFFNPLILLASVEASLQLCNLAYVASQPSTPQQTLNNFQYLVLTVLALAMIGYSGNCIKVQSLRITDAIMRCPWHLCGHSFRRDILILMENLKQPMVITGGKFFILDYEKLKAIFSAAFSYYTLLEKMG